MKANSLIAEVMYVICEYRGIIAGSYNTHPTADAYLQSYRTFIPIQSQIRKILSFFSHV